MKVLIGFLSSRVTQAVSTAPSAKTHTDDCTLLRPTTSILPITQPTSVWGQEVSLRDIFVPLSDIEPSE